MLEYAFHVHCRAFLGWEQTCSTGMGPPKQSLLLARAAELGCRACFWHAGHFIELYKLCWSSWNPWESDPVFAGTSWNKKGRQK